MSNKSLNCAVIGLGVGEQHARALLNHPDVNLAAVCDLDDNKVAEFIKKYNLHSSVKKTFDEILLDETIKLVSIASFDDVHFEQIINCFKYRKHVFVEKPMCQTQAQLKIIYNAWKNSNLALSSNLILRKAPLYLWLENAIKSGDFGELYAIDMDYLYGRIHKITDGWRANINNYSVMAGGGIHMIDLMLRLTKCIPSKVQSSVNKIVTNKTAFKYHDFHTANFHFANGMLGRINANFGCVHKHQHVVRIFGTKATFIYDDAGARVHWHRDEQTAAEVLSFSPKPADKGALLLDYVDSILKNDYQNTQLEFDLMSATLAADEAIKHHHSPIEISYLTN